MKKEYLRWAGIGSVLVLTGMFAIVIATWAIPALVTPAITVDPIAGSNPDANNRLILTGTTTLSDRSEIRMNVNGSSGATLATGYVQILPGTGGKNRWKGIVDLSPLPPAEYTIVFVTAEYVENFTRIVESDPLATSRFTLGDGGSGPGSIRKKTVTETPFIRINAPGANASPGTVDIDGITNLAPGTRLAWTVAGMIAVPGNLSGVSGGGTTVVQGLDGINRWSFAPAGTVPLPARCRVTVTALPGENVTASAEFNLTAPGMTGRTVPGQGPGGYLAIDALPDMRTSGVYTISGTTSLPAGDTLLFQVLPYFNGTAFDLVIDPKDQSQRSAMPFSGASGMISVAEGSGTTRPWAFTLESYTMAPGPYIVFVNNDRFDPATMKVIPGGLSGSRVFTMGDGAG